ncbi:MAG TPA: chemotaxis protein CheA [Opitutaceae bacterium]|jgi:two-component system chemotaxis sensor kinase CheA
MQPEPPRIAEEALDDFFTECDEHLTAIRAGLSGLESGDAPAALQGLFRSTHSLKGICAIVGLRDAEQVAHVMEDVFRGISKGEIPAAPSSIDVLIGAAGAIERIVSSFRTGNAAAPDDDAVRSLQRLLQTGAAAGPVPQAHAGAERQIAAIFAPSKELTDRGVNISSIRKRLASLGRVLDTRPIVKGPGVVIFEIPIALSGDAPDSSAWADSGVSFSEPREPQAPPKPAEQAAASAVAPSHVVRVDLARLDELMRITGDMVIHRSRIEEKLRLDGFLEGGMRESFVSLSRSLREMREAVSRVRMVPISEIFDRVPFIVRDLARTSDKKSRVDIAGAQTEVDKFLVERLREPLLHLVRNSFSHGVEPEAERVAAGKPGEALISLRAAQAGDTVVIEVEDDGRGVDEEAVRRRAAQMGILADENGEPKTLLEILCTPGFSSRDAADTAAGRGIGMAVVAAAARELGGTLSLSSTRGQGTKFTLRMPLNLSIVDAIVLAVGRSTYALAKGYIQEIIQADASEVRTVRSTELIPYRDSMLSLVRLRGALGIEPSSARKLLVAVSLTERGPVGLVADAAIAQKEIVVRPLSDPLLRVPGVSGVTELGDGRPVFVLDPESLRPGVLNPAGAQ